LQDQDGDGRIILQYKFKKYDGQNWIDLAEDRDERRAVVKTIINFRVP
jgi:hypothetical protein